MLDESTAALVPVKAEARLVGQKSTLASRRGRSVGTVYLLLDHSASMADGNKLLQLKRGALRFFGEAWLRDYAVGAVAFSSRASCLIGASRDFYTFEKRIATLQADGRTAMASALRLATWRLRWRKRNRVIVLITDGQPNDRTATLQAAATARAAGIELIAVGTSGADEAFLAALTPKPELRNWVAADGLEQGVALSAHGLPQP